jgi:hypothetical protein
MTADLLPVPVPYTVTIPVSCVRCGGTVHSVTADDPVGWVNRERRLVIQCDKPWCAWSGVIHVELIDLTHKRNVA